MRSGISVVTYIMISQVMPLCGLPGATSHKYTQLREMLFIRYRDRYASYYSRKLVSFCHPRPVAMGDDITLSTILTLVGCYFDSISSPCYGSGFASFRYFNTWSRSICYSNGFACFSARYFNSIGIKIL